MSENLFSPEEEARIRLQGQGGQGQGGQEQGVEGQGQGGQGQGQGQGGQGQGGQGQGGQGQGQGQGGQGQGVEGQGQGGQGQGQGQGGQGQGQGVEGQGQGQGQGVEGQGQGGQGQGGQGQGQGQGVEGQGQGQGGQDDDDEDDEEDEGEGQDEGEDEDENEGEDEGEEEDEEKSVLQNNNEQNEQNDSRIGQKCVILFPRDVAGLMGTIQEVGFRGVVDNEIEPRNINGYVLQLPRVEYTLFSILVTNLKGENETLPLMDIDIAFSGQQINYVENRRAFQGQVVQFVRTEPNLYLINVGGANRLAEHCFITPEQANQQNQNNNNQNDNDADDEEDDDNGDTPLDLIPSAFYTYLLRRVWKFENNLRKYVFLKYEGYSSDIFIDMFSRKFLETNGGDFFLFRVDVNLLQNRLTKEIYFKNISIQEERVINEIKKADIQALQTFLIFHNSLKSIYGDKFLPFMMASALLDNNNSDFIVWNDNNGQRVKLFRFDDLNGTQTICISRGTNELFFTEYKSQYDDFEYFNLGRFHHFDIMDFFAPTNNLPLQETQKQSLQRDMLGYLQAFLI